MKIKTVDHFSLAVSEIDSSIRFYCDVLGYELLFIERDMAKEIRSMTGLEQVSCHLAQMQHQQGGSRLELIEFLNHDLPALPLPLPAGAGHLAFEVENLDSALEEVRGVGANAIGNVTVFPEGRSTYCREPGGSFFELLEMNPA